MPVSRSARLWCISCGIGVRVITSTTALGGGKLLLGEVLEIPALLSLFIILGAVAISAAASLLMIPASPSLKKA